MPASVELVCIHPDDVAQIWPTVRDLIYCAIARTRLSNFARIEAQVLAGEQLLWLVMGEGVEAAGTTQLADGVCILVACGGRRRERWLQLLGGIENYARAEGCRCVRIYGRKGWARVLPGYRTEFLILERAL